MTSDALSRLRAGLDRDEALARAALDFPYDRPEDAPWVRMQWHVERGIAMTSDEHFARHDPARVLRQVAAIRRAIDAELENQRKFDAEFGCLHDAEDFLAGRCPSFRSPLLEALADIYPTETGDPS